MSGAILHETPPELDAPCLIASWPGMASVGLTTVHYLKEKLKASFFAELPPQDEFSPSGAIISNQIILPPEQPTNHFFYYRSPNRQRDLIFFLGSLQPMPHREYDFAKRVLDFAQDHGVRQVITAAAAPTDMDYRDKPRVFAIPNNPDALKRLLEYNVHFMGEGHVAGLNGLLIAAAAERGLSGLCLLGEIPFFTVQMEFPKAALAILEILCRFIGVSIETQDLEVYTAQKEKEIAQVAELLVQKESDEIKGEEAPPLPPSQEQTIPPSVRLQIEQLFRQAEFDGTYKSKMRLKETLDQWGLFDEYLDRFLDLFKRHGEG